MSAGTLYDKVWQLHRVAELADGATQLFIGLHLIHEVTSPQAFAAIRELGLGVRHPERTVATVDHIVPTSSQARPFSDPLAEAMLATLERNCSENGITLHGLGSGRQGIVHVIAPELGLTQPGMTVACGDSHTSTHGAFGALAHGIGTSEVEHVLATQCLVTQKMKTMRIRISGPLGFGVTAKDVILYVIGQIGTAGGTGCAIEFAGEAIESLSMEGRMTVCNMAIEAGARAGLIAVDQTTIDYVQGRPYAPTGADWARAVAAWSELHSDSDAHFDVDIAIDGTLIEPQVSWGTNPEMVTGIHGVVPDPALIDDPTKREGVERALKYMGLTARQSIQSIQLDRVFIGSCTNSRIEDLREAARVVEGKRVAGSVRQALVVPGSGLVKREAEREGLDQIFRAAGFEWRDPGCSMCLAMNADRLGAGEHCASTSNRNFEGRQGTGGRTHLVSPAMAAAAAIAGHFVDVREW